MSPITIPILLALAGTDLAIAPRAVLSPPAIELTFVPPRGSHENLEGRVYGVNPATHRVATYIFVEQAYGWWNKPYLDPRTVEIAPDGTFEVDITTGGIDPDATRIAVYLVADSFTPPACVPCADLPELDEPRTVVCRPPGERELSCLGRTWVVKRNDLSAGPVGPGPNYFDDSAESVFCDAQGLHLSIRFDGLRWLATEVVLQESLGFGSYVFEVEGRVDEIDANVVLGLFTWDDCAGYSPRYPHDHAREIDVEFARWGNPFDPENAQFVVQPWDAPDHLQRFAVTLEDPGVVTCGFHWAEDEVQFRSRTESETLSWQYAGADVPEPELENVRFNLWLVGGAPPTDGQELEVVISDFAFAPLEGE